MVRNKCLQVRKCSMKGGKNIQFYDGCSENPDQTKNRFFENAIKHKKLI